MSVVAEFLREKYDPRRPREDERFILLRELNEFERVHERLPHRLWLVLLHHAGADDPFAIIGEYDDDRGLQDFVKDSEEVTLETLDFWYMARRRMGDH